VDSVLSRAYLMPRPLYYYTNGAPQGAVQRYLRFVRSAHGQRVLRQCDFAPIIAPDDPPAVVR
jgi:phosphate transport system substrate-binding protein